MACVHISTKALRPGMYIVQTSISWQNRPYLYAKQGLINSEAEIASILEQGYVEAFYDPDRSTVAPEQETRPIHDLLTGRPVTTALAPKRPLAEELHEVSATYSKNVAQVAALMTEARHGRIDFQGSKDLVNDVIQSIDRNQDALTSLAKIKSHDEYTFVHSMNVAIFSVAFGRALGFEGEQLKHLGLAGLFHDIGKMRVPAQILNAPRKLTAAELALMQTHAQLGADMMKRLPGVSADIIDGVLDHHERYDGSGYPNKKKGAEIAPFGRIISVVDVYDALTSKRYYHDPIPPHKALSMMFGMRSDCWEPDLIERFIKTLGIYPVGTLVQLTEGFKGIVSQSNQQASLYPVVLLCEKPDGTPIEPPTPVDLSKQHNIQIIKTLPENARPYTLLDLLQVPT